MSYPATLDNLGGVTSGATITSAYQNSVTTAVNAIEGAVGVNPARALCEGRLTFTTGVPITTSDVTGATSVFFSPMDGNRIALYDGTSSWSVFALSADMSLALGTLSNATNYDVFCYDNAGTPTLELGPAWSSNTARATSIVLQDGVYVKSGATTRRYLGTFRTTSTTTTEDSAANRLLWNMYNRVPRSLFVTDTTASWTYSTASWRQANGSTSDQVQVVVGLAGPAIHLQADATRSNTSAAVGATGIGINSNSAPGSGVLMLANSNAASANATSTARYDGFPALGYSFYAWLEYGSGTGTDTWYGTSGQILSGMSGSIL